MESRRRIVYQLVEPDGEDAGRRRGGPAARLSARHAAPAPRSRCKACRPDMPSDRERARRGRGRAASGGWLAARREGGRQRRHRRLLLRPRPRCHPRDGEDPHRRPGAVGSDFGAAARRALLDPVAARQRRQAGDATAARPRSGGASRVRARRRRVGRGPRARRQRSVGSHRRPRAGAASTRTAPMYWCSAA